MLCPTLPPQSPRAPGACSLALSAVPRSRDIITKAASPASAALVLRSQDDLIGPPFYGSSHVMHHGALEAPRFQASVVPFPDWRSKPGPSTIAQSSGLDFINFIVGMDAGEAANRFRDAETFRILVPGATMPARMSDRDPTAAAPEPPPRTAERRSGSGLNLKQLTSFRDHVTRNLAPTVAHGFVKATATTRQSRASSSTSSGAAGAGQTAQPTAASSGPVNNAVPAERLLRLRPIAAAADSALPSPAAPAGPIEDRAPSETARINAAATRTATRAASPEAAEAAVPAAMASTTAAAAELRDSSCPLLDAGPLFSALACGAGVDCSGASSGTLLLMLPTSDGGCGDDAPNAPTAAAAAAAASATRSMGGEAGRRPPCCFSSPSSPAADSTVEANAAAAAIPEAPQCRAAAAAARVVAAVSAAPQRRRRGSRTARVGDAGRRAGGAGAGEGEGTARGGAAWL
ncbi:hypothetical protein PLESTB_001672600 [Pleodorina starrii]|uniref:Uncharacterized protein n=1 Tax=Pleodorina starrii TaxID=330485 RepID=A0A9W6BZP9_9CHLO|nr:hypothetical protein PLESTM_000622000 [Pleodorina starrii]GLC60802.1 hypothetical protein PLESTB_001672600 [Pleodorina starrii]GLC75521.1 hypothetical protein PLESTF_001647000 [Pleodorina starrii]